MLDIKGLAEMYVVDAKKLGHDAHRILRAVMTALEPLEAEELAARIAKEAKELTFDSAEDQLGHSMSEFWESDDVDELEATLKVRFPRHHKTIDNIIEWAGDASNEREDMGKDGDDREFQRVWDKTMNALKKLPWEKK